MMGKYKVNKQPGFEGKGSNTFENQYMKDDYMPRMGADSAAANFMNVVDVPLGSMR